MGYHRSAQVTEAHGGSPQAAIGHHRLPAQIAVGYHGLPQVTTFKHGYQGLLLYYLMGRILSLLLTSLFSLMQNSVNKNFVNSFIYQC